MLSERYRELIASAADMRLECTANGAGEALRRPETAAPDILLVDLGLPMAARRDDGVPRGPAISRIPSVMAVSDVDARPRQRPKLAGIKVAWDSPRRDGS